MNDFRAKYERILKVLSKISEDQLLTMERRDFSMGDLELISLILTDECMGVYNENNISRILPPCFKGRVERTMFNRRKRRSISYQIAIWVKLALSFN